MKFHVEPMTNHTTPVSVGGESLAPCPFCGDTRTHIVREHDPDGFGIFYSVKCHACRAQSGSVYASNGNDCPIHYQEVREAWNRRAPPPPPQGEGKQQGGGWQPIETAPKDGTTILLCFMQDGEVEQRAEMQWSHIQRNGLFPGAVGMWVCPGGNFTWNPEPKEFGPTHWMPVDRSTNLQGRQVDKTPIVQGQGSGGDEGMVLVPREPTPEMCAVASIDEGAEIIDGPAFAAELYKAMLAAAPADAGGNHG